VKCKVQNIAVDISVNQIGGPNKVYFLEKVIVFFSRTRRRTAHHYIEREKGPKWTKVQCHNRQKNKKEKQYNLMH
jgi:hypothetical protein